MAAKVNREANLRGGCGAATGRLRPPAKFSWYPASLVGILDGPFRDRELSLVPGQTWLASLMASIEARKFSWYPARLRRRPQPPRGLGNVQRRVLSLPRPRKRSEACFGAFRRVGNVQRRVLMLSEASEMFSGVFWSFPTRRKRSAARFDVFRGLGAAAGRLRPPAKYFWYPASLAGVPDASEGGQTCAAGRSPPIPPIFAAGYLVYGCAASDPIPCLTTTYYSEITLTTTYNGITVWNRRASQRGEVDLV